MLTSAMRVCQLARPVLGRAPAQPWKVHAAVTKMVPGLGQTRMLDYFGTSYCRTSVRGFSSDSNGEVIEIKFPKSAESVTEGAIGTWNYAIGDYIPVDETIVTIDTDKTALSVNAEEGGELTKILFEEGDTVEVGALLGEMKKVAPPPTEPPNQEDPTKEETTAEPPSPPPREPPTPPPQKPEKDPQQPPSQPNTSESGNRVERLVKMTPMRKTIASRLKESQNTTASLTTFNEIDMSKLMDMRARHKDKFLDKYGVKLGFMSAFVAASTKALLDLPSVNASIQGDHILYHDYVDISIAVSSPKGLVVPVLRNVEGMSFADIEGNIAELGRKAKDSELTLEEMAGGTFTVTNGGVFGSMMSTPMINMPQSAILGMHNIVQRPVVVDGEIVIRPIMYVALTYDHRLIDGRESVTFLKSIKEKVEDPERLLLDL